ncbi:hypothetical protein FM037_03210 [Shewanella psychropiezotolerans]|uniref:Uncharacterized protein n=1 Tax=Shewanella psychropiezotolerans TaxID=2593655 RepID=A0ABX5WTL5_9GAMM|nr:hypothetical protein [Shewanella psychropiezotolerans]QDO82433.1 hypothetical protein FM037_03210 [Shewanella psychropiezotolerans]
MKTFTAIYPPLPTLADLNLVSNVFLMMTVFKCVLRLMSGLLSRHVMVKGDVLSKTTVQATTSVRQYKGRST